MKRVRIEGGRIRISGELYDERGSLVAVDVDLEDKGNVYTSTIEAAPCDFTPDHDDGEDLPFLAREPAQYSKLETDAVAVVVRAIKTALHDDPLLALTRAGLIEGQGAESGKASIIRALWGRSTKRWSRPSWVAKSNRFANAARRVAELHDELAYIAQDSPVDLSPLISLAATAADALNALNDGIEQIAPEVDAVAPPKGGSPGKGWREDLAADLEGEWTRIVPFAAVETALDAACGAVDLIDLSRPETIGQTDRLISSGKFDPPGTQRSSALELSAPYDEDSLPFS